MQIDLNCDMGESFGRYTLGFDNEVMPFISSANIACGFHAGDPMVMRKTCEIGARCQVGLGAHPGFPDLAGFGRREMRLSPQEVRDTIIYQISALMGFAWVCGTTLRHVKPHGALYTMANHDETIGGAIVEAILELNEQLILFGLPGSKLLKIASAAGLRIAREGFADRAYTHTGTLVARHQTGAVITDSSAIVDRALKIVQNKKITTITGTELDLECDTLCVHGDTPGAVEHVKQIAVALKQAGVRIAPVGNLLSKKT